MDDHAFGVILQKLNLLARSAHFWGPGSSKYWLDSDAKSLSDAESLEKMAFFKASNGAEWGSDAELLQWLDALLGSVGDNPEYLVLFRFACSQLPLPLGLHFAQAFIADDFMLDGEDKTCLLQLLRKVGRARSAIKALSSGGGQLGLMARGCLIGKRFLTFFMLWNHH